MGLGCLRKTVSRVLVLIISMGFGVVVPYLGAVQQKVSLSCLCTQSCIHACVRACRRVCMQAPLREHTHMRWSAACSQEELATQACSRSCAAAQSCRQHGQ